MTASEAAYDLVLTGARICDPATGLDRNCDLAVNGDRIAAIGAGLAAHAGQVITGRAHTASPPSVSDGVYRVSSSSAAAASRAGA